MQKFCTVELTKFFMILESTALSSVSYEMLRLLISSCVRTKYPDGKEV